MMFNSALVTDLYQLTMAEAAWQSGRDRIEACFYAHFRKNPFEGGYAIACGAASIAEFIEDFAFTEADLSYLASLPAPGGGKLFDPAFLQSLLSWQLSVDVDCVPEGTVVFAQEPILRVTGPLSQCMLLETPLLNLLGYQTLIATKAARVCSVTHKPVAEFGLRRAHGPYGGDLASRAAFVGGCASTSNVHAGMLYGIPVSGTHSHAWVMAFESELEAFRSYVRSFPHNAILLVDTYNAFKGVENAITVAKEMAAQNQQLVGIRIDSGDLAWQSIEFRRMLDAAGCQDVKIIASNDLDEYTILSLEAEQKASIDSWGVGTRLVTAYDQPALGMVYKLSALRYPEKTGDAGVEAAGGGVASAFTPASPVFTTVLKASGQSSLKATLPGMLASRRYYDNDGAGYAMGDMIYDQQMRPLEDRIIDPFDPLRQKDLSAYLPQELLTPLIRKGQLAEAVPTAHQAQALTRQSIETLPLYNRRLLNPHSYPVGLERQLAENRDRLLKAAH